MKYIEIPQTINYNELRGGKCCLSPSKYAFLKPSQSAKNVLFIKISALVILRDERTKINYKDNYYYIEIGNIDVETGGIEYKEYRGIFLPNKNPLKIGNGDILISTVRTYRKGIGFVNLKENNITGTSAFIIIKSIKDEFENDITKEYLYPTFRTLIF